MLDLETRDRLVRELSELSELELESVMTELRPHIEKNKLQHVIDPYSLSEKEDMENALTDAREERDEFKQKYNEAQETINDIRNLL